MYNVYVLRSESTGKVYVGQTGNLESRLARHNGLLRSKARSYTKINKGQWNLVYKEEFDTRQEAIKREKHLKSHIGRDWLKNILAR